MADGYWGRQQPLHPSAPAPKRPRPDYDYPPGGPSGHEKPYYLPQDDDPAGRYTMKDTKSIGASYDRYLHSTQMSSFGSGEASHFGSGGLGRVSSGGIPDLAAGMHGPRYGDSGMMVGPGPRTVGPDMVANGRGMGFGGQLPVDSVVRPGPPGREIPLPPDASNTLFVEGLPRDCTQREVAHIFRPFVGYKEVRLVTKEPKYHSGEPIVLCFVDFTNPACALTAMNALQGYKVDEHDPDSAVLRVQFSRFPGPKSGYGSRGRK